MDPLIDLVLRLHNEDPTNIILAHAAAAITDNEPHAIIVSLLRGNTLPSTLNHLRNISVYKQKMVITQVNTV